MKWIERFKRPAKSDGPTPQAAGQATDRKSRRLKSMDELWDFIGYVVLCAPDKFPRRDYLADNEQMNLEIAFETLQVAIAMAYPEEGFAEKRLWLEDALKRSLVAYKQGDRRG
jgi:hypothetical protein